MDVIYGRCCGIDVHKRTVVACLLTPDQPGRRRKEVRTFQTSTPQVLALAAGACRFLLKDASRTAYARVIHLATRGQCQSQGEVETSQGIYLSPD